MNRLVIVARLKDGARAEAETLIRGGPPFDPDELGLTRHGVYLTATDVVFVFEAREVEWIVNDVIDHPVFASAFGPWRALVDGPPRLAHEQYFWSREQNKLGVGLGV